MHEPKVAVVLSGCGVYDGSEIHEAVLTLLALERHGAVARCFAPDVAQRHVIDHLTGRETGETRNVLTESARIARGKITALSELRPDEHDALVLPGGFGAAKNLSSFAVDGAACTVHPEVEAAIVGMRQLGRPIGALCIAPALLAKVLGGVELTIGSDPDTAAALEAMGARHRKTTHGEVIVDREALVVTGPCYMLDATIAQVADGADAVVRAVLELARRQAEPEQSPS
jgi:enhancing lycopene biosynthesis protein 2